MARGATPNFHSQTDIFPLAVNVPIACGGTVVVPGDIIVADDDGAVVVPIALAPRLLEAASEHAEWEEFSRMRLAEGGDLRRYYPLSEAARPEYERVARGAGGEADGRPSTASAERLPVKITELVPWLVRSPASFWGEFLFVEVRTDEGVTGWGEVTSTTRTANRAVAADGPRGQRPRRRRRPGRDRADLAQGLPRLHLHRAAAGAAVHRDQRGRHRAVGHPGQGPRPAGAELLGGRSARDLLLYTHPDQSRFGTPEGVAEEIGRIVGSGHTAIKFDPFPHCRGRAGGERPLPRRTALPRATSAEPIELTAQIREAAGPDVELLVDAHGRFDVPTAIRLAQTPRTRPPTCTGSRSRCRRRATTPCGRCATAYGCPSRSASGCTPGGTSCPVLEGELADFVMPDVTWTGGISELKKIATMAEAYYVPVSPHDAAGPVNLVAGAQVMATDPELLPARVEQLRPGRVQRAADQVPLDNPGGALQLPSGPGLGIELRPGPPARGNVLDGFCG